MPLQIIPILTLAFMIIGAPGCSQRPAERQRPKGIPAEAFFVGGNDGGVFLLCKDTPDKYVYHCTIFDDHQGTLLNENNFRTATGQQLCIDVANRSIFSAWDGSRILLKDGRWMESMGGKQESKGDGFP